MFEIYKLQALSLYATGEVVVHAIKRVEEMAEEAAANPQETIHDVTQAPVAAR